MVMAARGMKSGTVHSVGSTETVSSPTRLRRLVNFAGCGCGSANGSLLVSRAGGVAACGRSGFEVFGFGFDFDGGGLAGDDPDFAPPLPPPLSGRFFQSSSTFLQRYSFSLNCEVSPYRRCISATDCTPPGSTTCWTCSR